VAKYVKLEGGDELIAELARMGVNVKKSLRGAIRAGAKLVQAEADARAPSSRAGKKAALQVSSPKRDQVEARVKPTRKRWYLRFFETGTAPHEIAGRPLLAFEGEGGRFVRARRIKHPGMPARPWLRPALEAQSDAAVAAIGESLRAAVVEARITAEGNE